MDSRLMQIAECGAFKGSACIDIAEIHGNFDGDLTVRDKLMIYATGKITGKVRYGKLVIEEGGQLSGEVIFGTVADKATSGERAARRSAGRPEPEALAVAAAAVAQSTLPRALRKASRRAS